MIIVLVVNVTLLRVLFLLNECDIVYLLLWTMQYVVVCVCTFSLIVSQKFDGLFPYSKHEGKKEKKKELMNWYFCYANYFRC